jgi:surfeit locus 1 family protein
MRFQPLPGLTLGALVALAILIGLGGWQWGRYVEKLRGPGAGPSEISLGPIAAAPGKSVYLYAMKDSAPGWRVLHVVEVGEGPLAQRWWVDAAFVPGAAIPDLSDPPPALTTGIVLAGHTLAPPRAGSFSPPADLAQRAFYSFDAKAMAQAAGVSGLEPQIVALPYVGADGRPVPNPFLSNPTYLNPERHFGYALTWWGLAAALVGVYLAFHVQAGRLRLRP